MDLILETAQERLAESTALHPGRSGVLTPFLIQNVRFGEVGGFSDTRRGVVGHEKRASAPSVVPKVAE